MIHFHKLAVAGLALVIALGCGKKDETKPSPAGESGTGPRREPGR